MTSTTSRIFSSLKNLCHASSIRYTNKTEKVMYRNEIFITDTTVCKAFNMQLEQRDGFGKTPAEYYRIERETYEKLDDIYYYTNTGERMKLVPKCLEIGKNYILIEKYEYAMSEQIKRKKLFEKYSSIQQVIEKFVVPIANKLDEMHLIHNDLHPRNIVFDLDFNRVSVIDFGLASFTKPTKKNRDINKRDIKKFVDMYFYPDKNLFTQDAICY